MISIAIAGFGLVGESFYNLIKNDVNVEYVFVKNVDNKKDYYDINFIDQADLIVESKSIDIIVECISDPETAFRLIKSCLLSGKDVVTCNKILIKTRLAELSFIANENECTIYLSSIPSGSKPGEFVFPITHINFQSQMSNMPFIFRGGGAQETATMMKKDVLEIIK
jgi:homoserine dehydrogenase